MVTLLLVLLGLCAGSYVSALVWRLQQTTHLTHHERKQRRELSMWRGRSMCSHCRHPLKWYDLLPLASWLSLWGKCRYCGNPIEDSPFTELATAVLFVASYLFWPLGFNPEGTVLFLMWLIFLVGFVALAVYDLRWHLLPNKLIFPLFGLAVAQVLLVALIFEGDDALVRAMFGLLIGGGIFWLLFQVSQGRWIGGGDVKLGALLGLLIGGPLNMLLVLFLAALLGSLTTLPLLATKRLHARSHIPFGPFLILAAIVMHLFGPGIVSWYKSYFLFV